jgi:hypothetical protein
MDSRRTLNWEFDYFYPEAISTFIEVSLSVTLPHTVLQNWLKGRPTSTVEKMVYKALKVFRLDGVQFVTQVETMEDVMDGARIQVNIQSQNRNGQK